MKTPDEWYEIYNGNPLGTKELIVMIQKDALQSAVLLCEKQSEEDGADDECGHANRGVFNCVEAIQGIIPK